MKNAALALLRRLGLIRPAFRAYELAQSARALRSRSPSTGPDGLPFPPARLRVSVAGTASVEWFLEGGREAAASIRDALGSAGADHERLESMLDFGCGCGRVVRHWAGLSDTRVEGTDSNEQAVSWCAGNLTFAHFARNELEPPLAYDSGSFDLVYALSVFTHIPDQLQEPWLAELRRVLTPGGWLLLTTQGDAYADKLSTAERERYEAGELVVRDEGGAGSNLCTVFHPPSYVARETARGFELVELVPSGARGNPVQDLVLLRAP